jgi:hypothetical protein
VKERERENGKRFVPTRRARLTLYMVQKALNSKSGISQMAAVKKD